MAKEHLILRKLENIEKEVRQIRARMPDIDSIMTEEDYSSLNDYRREKMAGRLHSHESVKKKLDL